MKNQNKIRVDFFAAIPLASASAFLNASNVKIPNNIPFEIVVDCVYIKW